MIHSLRHSFAVYYTGKWYRYAVYLGATGAQMFKYNINIYEIRILGDKESIGFNGKGFAS